MIENHKFSLAVLLVLLSGCSAPSPKELGFSEKQSEDVTQCIGPVVEGIDVSDAQGSVSWSAVKADGIDFAYMKATQGTYNTNWTFGPNWSGSKSAGVARGAYHFFDPTEDGVAQANYFLDAMGPLQPGDLPPALDLECPDGDNRCLGWAGGTGWEPGGTIAARAQDWLDTVEAATGVKPVVYTFYSYLSSNGVSGNGFGDQPLWIAAWSHGSCFNVPGPWTGARLWQWADDGNVGGEFVDRDRFLGTQADLDAFSFGGGGGGSGSRFVWDGQWLTGFGAPDWAASGDFNGDGKADLAWYEAWNDHSITVALSDGHGHFGNLHKWLSGAGAPDWAGVGDFDGDGRADIAWYEHWNGGKVTVLKSTGSSFGFAGAWLSGFGVPDWAAAGDFNGDGKDDLAWYEAWNGHAITVALAGNAKFVPNGKWVGGWGRPDAALVGDFNGDGKADVAWYEGWQNAVTVGLGAGNHFAWGAKWLTGWGLPDEAFAGDADGDGRADLLWYEQWNHAGVTVGLAR